MTVAAAPLNPNIATRKSIPNAVVRAWVEESIRLCAPDQVVICDGSESEKQSLLAKAVAEGVLVELNQAKWPGCYYHRSNSNDVARTEHLTFICTPSADMAGPTNNFMNDKEAYKKLRGLYDGCMKGRT